MREIGLNYVKNLENVLDDYNIIEENIKKVLTKNIKDVIFIGSGANYSQTLTMKYMFEGMINNFNCYSICGGQVERKLPAYIGANSLIIGMSHSGNTTEVCLALEKAKNRGATVIGISSNDNSRIADLSEFHYQYPGGSNMSEMKLIVLTSIVLVIAELTGTKKEIIRLKDDLHNLPQYFYKAHDIYIAGAEHFAEECANKNMIYTMGCGPTMGPAYAFAICKLMEMQWKDAATLNAAEFFHGPLEVVDSSRTFLLFAAGDRYSKQVHRVYKYLESKECNCYFIDSTSVYKNENKKASEYLSPLLLWPALTMYAYKLEEKTGHNLDIRRNMGKEGTEYPWDNK